jgi:threonine/homoserine/homoserine lactone efflux protein
LLYISGYGIAEIITRSNTIGLIIKVIGSAWLLYLAIVISRLSTNIKTDKITKLGFPQGFLMQFVNLKAWFMAISAAGAFMPQTSNIHINVLVFALIFCLVGIPCMITWVFMGDIISKTLKQEKTNKIIGYVLSLLLMISIIFIWV